MKIIALDIGTKRIGTAHSDENQKIAFPGKVFSADQKESLMLYIKEQGVKTIVIGYTKDQNAKLVTLREGYKSFLEESGYEVEYQDESMTSHESRLREMTKGNTNTQRQMKKDFKKEIDHIAAMHILQRYLDKK